MRASWNRGVIGLRLGGGRGFGARSAVGAISFSFGVAEVDLGGPRMAKAGHTTWVNNTAGSPRIQGNLEISKSRDGVFIGGDPDALRSLATLLVWLANVDQESLPNQPAAARLHVHLHARDVAGFNSLTRFSTETELCRLDAKGTGDFPEKYRGIRKGRKRAVRRPAKGTGAKRVKK